MAVCVLEAGAINSHAVRVDGRGASRMAAGADHGWPVGGAQRREQERTAVM
jgi:hypothetical protein